MEEKRGPVLPNPLSVPEDINRLKTDYKIEEFLSSMLNALFLTRKALNGEAVLLGFAGAPWTLFTYMVEGSGSKTFAKSKGWIYKNPVESLKVLDILADAIS